jgi:predicted RNA-binding protein with PIN domain
MNAPARYLIVDGHSVIFASPQLRALHQRRSAHARETLIKQLRHYQDWTGVRVIVVFDGKGAKIDISAEPHDVQIFYSRAGETADAIVERLASKYAKRFHLTVATSDNLERETASAAGAECISPEMLFLLLEENERHAQSATKSKRRP